MTFTKINLYTASRTPEFIGNLWFRDECDAFKLSDAVEDSKNAADLVERINKLKLLRKFEFNRETEQYIRLKSTDAFGNVSYLEIRK